MINCHIFSYPFTEVFQVDWLHAVDDEIIAKAIFRRIDALRKMAEKGNTDTETGKRKKKTDELMSRVAMTPP